MKFDMSTGVDNLAMVCALQESQVDDLFDEVMEKYEGRISVQSLEMLFSKYEIAYDVLPQYLKDRIDLIDVY